MTTLDQTLDAPGRRDGAIARYYDGKNAVAIDATARADSLYLSVLSADASGVLARLPIRELALLAVPQRGVPAMVGSANPEDLRRVVILDESVLDAILRAAPHLKLALKPPRDMGRTFAVGLLASLVCGTLGAFGWPPVADQLARATPIEWERRLGERVAPSVVGSAPACAGAPGQAALDRLVHNIAGKAGETMPLSVRVVRQSTVNAFALPGGRIYLFSKLIDEAQGPGEVAGVLAHEIAHVIERHAMRHYLRTSVTTLVSKALFGTAGMADHAAFMTTLAYSRELESEADQRAIVLLQEAGLSADGLGRFFARLEKRDSGISLFDRYLSTHPPTAERRALAEQVPRPGALRAMTNAEWRAVRDICGK